jgi:hypothetical protein
MTYEWLKTASATFAGGAVAIGLVAIPTYVWLPREFDEIAGKLDSLGVQVASIEATSLQTSKAALDTVRALDNLVAAIALANARPVGGEADSVVANDPLLVALAYPQRDQFLGLLPVDVGQTLVADGKLAAFRYSRFNDTDWVYSTSSDFNGLSSDLQTKIIEAFERQNVIFRLLPEG